IAINHFNENLLKYGTCFSSNNWIYLLSTLQINSYLSPYSFNIYSYKALGLSLYCLPRKLSNIILFFFFGNTVPAILNTTLYPNNAIDLKTFIKYLRSE